MDQFIKNQNAQAYVTGMRPVFNRRALFSDTTANFIHPAEPRPYDQLSIRFRCAKNNLDRVFVVCKGQRELMAKVEHDEQFDYYEYILQLENETIHYHFEIELGKIRGCFDARGLVKEANEYYDFVVIPGFKTPDWAKGAVMYQIYVDRFCNGDPSNDVESHEYTYIGQHVHKVEDWSRYPAAMDVREFYGGDLQGVIDKLDYLQDLGVEVIYFNPLFVSPSNHGYDTQDYDHIDPHLGKIVEDGGEVLPEWQMENCQASKYISRVTNQANLEASDQLFIELVEKAHERGIRVILDGVFNHCGSFNKWLDREGIYENAGGYAPGAFKDGGSPYRDYFLFRDPYHWPNNYTYDGWWGHDTLPKLNYEGSRALMDYVLGVARKWVSPPFNADGWRLDVAADLGFSPEFNHCFWQEFRKAVKDANPEAIILAEHYGNTRDWLKGNEWDGVMNYDAFMEPLTWFLTGMEKHSDDFRGDMLGNADNFWGAMKHHCSSFAMPSWLVSMNQLSNHDHSRFLTRTNHKVGRTATLGPEAASQDINRAVFMEAVVFQMTWPGAPTLYYGDEAGVCGFTDPDNRRTYPWGQEDQEILALHKYLIHMHKEREALKTGSVKYVKSEYNFLSFGRFNKDSAYLVVINNSDQPVEKELSVWDLNVPKESVMKRLILTSEEGFDTQPVEYPVIGGRVKISLPKTSALVLEYLDF